MTFMDGLAQILWHQSPLHGTGRSSLARWEPQHFGMFLFLCLTCGAKRRCKKDL